MVSLQIINNQAFGLLGLPQELFEEILDLLSTPDAIRLLLANGQLFNANYPRVYRAFLNEKPDNRDFLWSWAALRGFTSIINFALDEEGVNVNDLIRCSYDETHWFLNSIDNLLEYEPVHALSLLHLSIIGRQPDLSRWLLEEKGADALVRGKGLTIIGTTITTAIICRSELSMHLTRFWKKERYTKVSSLYHAIRVGSIDLVRYLCSRGADVNDDKGNSGSPLTTAVESGSHEVAGLLLALGANPNGVVATQPGPRHFRNRKINPIVAAAMTGDEEMMRLLVNSGADVNRAIDGAEMLTPLCMAVQNNSLTAARLLLKCGALPNLAGGLMTWTPYGLALHKTQYVGRPNADILDLLISYDADPNRRQWNQPPAIFLAMQLGISTPIRRDIFHRALEHGVDLDEAIPQQLYTQYGLGNKYMEDIRWSALHNCLMRPSCDNPDPIKDGRGKQSLVGTLLDHGADPLSGYKAPVDVPKTPLGFFLRSMIEVLGDDGHKSLRSYEKQLDAMLTFVSQPRGGHSTAAFPVDVVARLLGIVALLPPVSCRWYGPYRQSQIQRFAEATCVGDRAVHGKDAWLATLLRSPGYWSLWEVCGRDSDAFQCLREGAGKLAGDNWEKICPGSPTSPFRPMNGKRRLEDEKFERGLVDAKKPR